MPNGIDRRNQPCTLVLSVLVVAAALSATPLVAGGKPVAPRPHHRDALFVPPSDIKWERMEPELGERSAEIAILHVDPASKATQLMIRVPPDTYVPRPWHSANETHTI